MALPTSTIVMAVLTCVPFGLAIRETVSGKAPVARGDEDPYASDDDSDGHEAYSRIEAQRLADEAEQEANERLEQLKQERQRTARRELFGAEVATLGSGFRGISLGMPEAAIRSELVTALETTTGVDIELLTNDKLDWLMIKPERGASADDSTELCSKLGQDLQEAWGRGQTEDYESRYWVNATTGTRASISSGSSDGCRLSFERFAAPKDWVTKTQTSIVPIWLVGQSTAKLREYIGARSEFDDIDSDVRWLGLGVGLGQGEARFEAFMVKGKVVAITAAADTFEATRDDVIAQLSSLYGPAIVDDEGVRWKSKPAIRLGDREGAGVQITVGKLPSSE